MIWIWTVLVLSTRDKSQSPQGLKYKITVYICSYVRLGTEVNYSIQLQITECMNKIRAPILIYIPLCFCHNSTFKTVEGEDISEINQYLQLN